MAMRSISPIGVSETPGQNAVPRDGKKSRHERLGVEAAPMSAAALELPVLVSFNVSYHDRPFALMPRP